ncbi:hypothetical protein HZA40_01680 [Candidatus Peregrinibacteria bacterium]|nr:hypothetical protein [Candidatus Peregrinibacteria bacterium]
MANFAYFDQLEQKINFFLTEKKYKEAFNLCKEAIVLYPDEGRFVKIKNRIEQAVESENEKIIQEKLDQIKPLWKEEKYLEILKILKALLAGSPNNNKLKNLYLKGENAYRKQYEKLKEEFKNQQRKRLNETLEKNPGQLLDELFTLEKENPGNQEVKNIVLEMEDKLIANKIAGKKELLESNKYDVIENFIDELRKIDKFSRRIQDLEQAIKTRKLEGEITQTKEYVYGGEKYLDTLMKLEKFDKAIQVCEEILKVNPNNQLAKEILEKAEEKYHRQVKYQTAEAILKNYPTLKTEYKQDKNKFIKL